MIKIGDKREENITAVSNRTQRKKVDDLWELEFELSDWKNIHLFFSNYNQSLCMYTVSWNLNIQSKGNFGNFEVRQKPFLVSNVMVRI